MINRRFRIEKFLGEGRSRVFSAIDTFHDKKIVLKILDCNTDAAEQDLFRNEFQLLSALHHPGIIKAYELGKVLTIEPEEQTADIKLNDVFITQDYFEGIPLNEFIGKLSYAEINTLIAEVSRVLFYLHQSNYLYLDLKPENLLYSSDGKNVKIKFIDFGLSCHISSVKRGTVFGSSSFIAPEILNGDQFDIRADLYSFGVLIYQILFNSLPFDHEAALDIYKAQLKGNIKFPPVSGTEKYRPVISKLMAIDPAQRYSNSLEVLPDLNIELPSDFISRWNYPFVYSGRVEPEKTIENFISAEGDCSTLILRGENGSGKSALIKKIAAENRNTLPIRVNSFRHFYSLNLNILYIFYYNSFVNREIPFEIKKRIGDILDSGKDCGINELKTILSAIASKLRLIILVDDYDRLGSLYSEYFLNILPVFLINGSKLIISTGVIETDLPFKQNKIQKLNLEPFSLGELENYIDKNFAPFFPRLPIINYLISYSHLNPSYISNFIRELVKNSVLLIEADGIKILPMPEGDKKVKLLSSDYFKKKLDSLSDDETNAVRMLSLVSFCPDEETFARVLNKNGSEAKLILEELLNKGVLSLDENNNKIAFSSEALKNYASGGIKNIIELHNKIGTNLWRSDQSNYLEEIETHFFKAGMYDECYAVERKIIERSYEAKAFGCVASVLKKALAFPLKPEIISSIKIELGNVLLLGGEFKEALSITDEILGEKLSPKFECELILRKCQLLIKTGEYAEAISMLNENSNCPVFSAQRDRINILFADAYLYLEEFEKASFYSKAVLDDANAAVENLGKANNFLALRYLYKEQDLARTIEYFEKASECFNAAGDSVMYAGMKMNIGNIYVMQNEYEGAIRAWTEVSRINKTSGNLEQEAKLLLNFGILYLDRNDYEKARENYSEAKTIFEHYGDKNSLGLTLINLGEIDFYNCYYDSAIQNLAKAEVYFTEDENTNDLIEIMFLKAKISFALWDTDLLKTIAQKLDGLINSDKTSPVQENKKLFVDAIIHFMEYRYDDAFELTERIINNSDQTGEREYSILLTDVYFLQAEMLFNMKKYDDLTGLMNSRGLMDIRARNIVADACSEYWIARALLAIKSTEAFEHLRKSFSLIQSISITELSWKVLMLFVRFYNERGDEKKAGNYIAYLREIFNHILSGFNNESSKKLFLNHREIVALQKLLKMNKII